MTILPEISTDSTRHLLVYAKPAERQAALQKAGLNTSPEDFSDESLSTRYEFHASHDYISIHLPNLANVLSARFHIEIYYNRDALVLLCPNEELMNTLLNDTRDLAEAERHPDKVLYRMFTHLLSKDAGFLAGVEDQIAQMEEQVVQAKPSAEFTADIVELRKKMLVMHRYYEALFDLLEDLEENPNGFLSKPVLRSFHLHTNRVDRLSNSVEHLRDYLTQVREAYQNQIDINLNRTMQFFTVIATIFLPLTLLVGWYGMNLKMPEYEYTYAYPILIVASIIIVVLSLWYFKRKKWF